jgi:hypothetical protein
MEGDAIMNDIVYITRSDLNAAIAVAAKKAADLALQKYQDRWLNIGQMCGEVEGLSRFIFNNLKARHKLTCVNGKYSVKQVRAALEKHGNF